MTEGEAGRVFDAYYFAHSCGRPYQRDEAWLGFFDGIAQRIVEEIHPRTVLDAGCAMGFLVEGLRRRGVEAYGLDVSDYAIAHVHPDLLPYCRVGSIADPLPRRYDLIVCIEVLEHMPVDAGRRAIANLCSATRDVLFSSTPFDYKEATHFNVQPPEVWAELFAQCGFVRDVDFDPSFVTAWSARFRASEDPPTRVLRDYERKFWLLWKENTDLRALVGEMRDQLAHAERAGQMPGPRIQEETQLLREKLERCQAADAVQVARTRELEATLEDLQAGAGWRMLAGARRLRLRLAPVGSRRDRLINSLLRRIRS
ncbi:MAG: methyltransferase domain-containing protein [Chloroflexi bacterium]|nr:methyltransferase domain-containing protein [Chloroflexota bacterium]